VVISITNLSCAEHNHNNFITNDKIVMLKIKREVLISHHH
jgi:hypothetical protein